MRRTQQPKPGDPEVEREILRVLGQVSEFPEDQDPVVAASRHGTTRARLAAIWSIAYATDARATTLLIEMLGDPDPAVGRAAAAALRAFGGPLVERKLEQALGSPNPAHRANAAFAVGELKLRSSQNRLVQMLHNERDPRVLVETARVLGMFEVRAAVPHLARLVEDPRADVAASAHAALVHVAGEDRGTTTAGWLGWWEAQ